MVYKQNINNWNEIKINNANKETQEERKYKTVGWNFNEFTTFYFYAIESQSTMSIFESNQS